MPQGFKGAAKRMGVAQRAGVSTTTVSLVLNDHPGARISKATRDRVRRAAEVSRLLCRASAMPGVPNRCGSFDSLSGALAWRRWWCCSAG